MKTRTELYQLAVKHFGEVDGEEQFEVVRSDVRTYLGDSYFLAHSQERRAYRTLFALKPGIAAEREIDGKVERVSLAEAISRDIRINRKAFGGNQMKPVITPDYAIYAFGKTEATSPLSTARN